MKIVSPVIECLARCYEKSEAGQTGLGKLDVQPELAQLLEQANCSDGDAHELAIRELQKAAELGLIELEPAHTRDRANIYKVRLSPAKEEAFYAFIGRPSPTAVRRTWSNLFSEAHSWPVTAEFAAAWAEFCTVRSASALQWTKMGEFKRAELAKGRELLQLVTRLLSWRERNHFIRAVSCKICGDSKTLEKLRTTLEKLLADASGGHIRNLAQLGILETPRHVLVAGPLRLKFSDHTIDIQRLRDGASLAESDIGRSELECDARCCVTVENKTSFHQRVLQHAQDLHIHTSYPNAATVVLLKKLGPNLDFVHLGDADPAGFDILRELRKKTKIWFRSAGMELRPDHKSPSLTTEEIHLLETLSCDPSLAPEHPAIRALLAYGRKGAFEQEHNPPPPNP
jgi:hypothetical protein